MNIFKNNRCKIVAFKINKIIFMASTAKMIVFKQR